MTTLQDVQTKPDEEKQIVELDESDNVLYKVPKKYGFKLQQKVAQSFSNMHLSSDATYTAKESLIAIPQQLNVKAARAIHALLDEKNLASEEKAEELLEIVDKVLDECTETHGKTIIDNKEKWKLIENIIFNKKDH